MKRFHIIACHVLWRELAYYAAQGTHFCDITFLRKGLHDTPPLLREQVQAAIDGLDQSYDAVLLGYGLCSNGLEGITARRAPLVVPRAHDCITLLLGSKERYREYFDSHPGTYWYSPGWIDEGDMPGEGRHRAAYERYVAQYGEENARYLMEMEQAWMNNYSNAAYVDLGVGDAERLKAFTRESAEWLGWSCDVLDGDPGLVKRFLAGDWDDEAFLVVQPGEMIAPSHDERVIAARPAPPLEKKEK